MLAIFFAGYLVQTRDVLSLAGRKVLGFTFPRARDLGPILVAWLASLGVLVFEKDLGSSLLFFGLFVAMLYVATERISWIAIGLSCSAAAPTSPTCSSATSSSGSTCGSTPSRPRPWRQSDQLAKGLMGMAAGGLLGTGLGRGRPDLTYFADATSSSPASARSSACSASSRCWCSTSLLVERGLRTALGVRDGFGKLLAAGLAFSVALQCFVVVGGVTRVIPLTGLTMPFLSYGGSSLLANWSLDRPAAAHQRPGPPPVPRQTRARPGPCRPRPTEVVAIR